MVTSVYSISQADDSRLQTLAALTQPGPSRLELMFTVAMLLYTAGAIIAPLLGGNDPLEMQTNPLSLGIKMAFYGIAFLFMLPAWRSLVRTAWEARWILMLVAIAAASVAWSQFPSDTLTGFGVLAATTAFGLYFGTRYTVSQQLRLLALTFSIAIAASVFFAVFLPAYGIEPGAASSDWRGAFLQKNNLAETMSLGLFVFLLVRPKRFHSLRWIGIAACLALLYLARSSTAAVVCFVILMTLPLYKLARTRFTLVIPVALGVGLVAAGFVLMLKTDAAGVFELVNRSPDLTGRTELWKAVLHSAAKRPWLGYGFSAFWKGMNGESANVLNAIGWPAGYGHDGYLDVLIQVGILGLLSFILGYLILWRRALSALLRITGPVPVWLCTYLVFMLLYNITEGYILTQNSLYWVLYIAVAVSLFRCTRAGSGAEEGSPE